MERFETPNKSSGVNTCEYIILHHTGSSEGTTQGLINAFTGQRQVSAHYLINEDGEVYKFGEDTDILFHAGKSERKGKTGLNAYSIGIELIGPLKDGGFTDKQRESLKTLLNSLSKEHNIEKDNIIRHKDISPSRKWDISDTLWNGEFKTFEEYKTSLFAKIEPMSKYEEIKEYKGIPVIRKDEGSTSTTNASYSSKYKRITLYDHFFTKTEEKQAKILEHEWAHSIYYKMPKSYQIVWRFLSEGKIIKMLRNFGVVNAFRNEYITTYAKKNYKEDFAETREESYWTEELPKTTYLSFKIKVVKSLIKTFKNK